MAMRLADERLETIKSEIEAHQLWERYNQALAERTGKDWDPIKGFTPKKVTFLGVEVPEALEGALEFAEYARVP